MGRVMHRVFAWVGVFALALGGRFSLAEDPKPERAADEVVKGELLQLNQPRTANAQRARLLAFLKDGKGAKARIAFALRMHKESKEEKPFNYSGSLLLARAAHAQKDYGAAEVFYAHCIDLAARLESGNKLLEAYDGLIDLHWDTTRYDDLIEVCERFAEIQGIREVENAKPFVLERKVQAKTRQGKIDEALQIVEDLLRLDEGGFYFVQLKGWVLREAGRYEESIDSYQEALRKVEETKRLAGDAKDRMRDRVRYILSGLYVDRKQIDKATERLQTLRERDPGNPTYPNDLGFVWADHDMNLDAAEKLIREAIDLDRKQQDKAKATKQIEEVKDNGAYLDSLGWVLFKQKKYAEALTHLKKASNDETSGSHLEIWDHLGDAYSALGRKQEATESWQKALTMEDVSKRDGERRRSVIAKLKAAGVEPKPGPGKPKPTDNK